MATTSEMVSEGTAAPRLQKGFGMKRLTVCLLAIVGLSACGVGVDDPEGQAALEQTQNGFATTSQAAATSTETRPDGTPAAAPTFQGTATVAPPMPVPGQDYLPQDPQPTRVIVPVVVIPVPPSMK